MYGKRDMKEMLLLKELIFNPHMNKENQEWEKRFEKTFPNTYYNESKNSVYEKRLSGCKKELKSFIRTELSKAREEERRKMLGKLTDEFYEFSTGKAWEAEQQEWVILHEPKEVIKRLTDAIKEIEK